MASDYSCCNRAFTVVTRLVLSVIVNIVNRHNMFRPSIHHIFNEKLTKRNSVKFEGK